MTPPPEPVILAAVRTPVGRYGGALSGVRPDDLAAIALRAAVERVPDLDPAAIDEVYLGCANQAGEDNRNVARMALLLAGLPSGYPRRHRQPPVRLGPRRGGRACQAIRAGEIELAVAGGVESMTRAPAVMGKDDKAFARGDRDGLRHDDRLALPQPPRWPSASRWRAWARPARTSPSAGGSAAPTRTPSRWEPAPLGGGRRRGALRRGARAGGGVRARRAPASPTSRSRRSPSCARSSATAAPSPPATPAASTTAPPRS